MIQVAGGSLAFAFSQHLETVAIRFFRVSNILFKILRAVSAGSLLWLVFGEAFHQGRHLGVVLFHHFHHHGKQVVHLIIFRWCGGGHRSLTENSHNFERTVA